MRFLAGCLIWLLVQSTAGAAVITIGTLAYDPPFGTAIDNKGHFFGFEMDLMGAICKQLHEQCEYKAFTFEKLLTETQIGGVDLALAGISITADRQQLFLFSLPYLESKAQLLALTSSPINSLGALKGKKIGIEAGTIFNTLAESKFKDVEIVEYDTQNDLFQAIANNKVDVIFLDQASAQYWVNNNSNLFKVIGPGIPVGMGYGVMANFAKKDLIERINNALIEIEKNGTYLAIYQRYF